MPINDDSTTTTFSIPPIGLGTWLAPPGIVGSAVTSAIHSGYRLIDCAAAYGNEAEIGQALNDILHDNVVSREDLCIVSKVFNTHHVVDGEDRPRESLLTTLRDLQLSHLDLLLMHWPLSFRQKTFPLSDVRDSKGRPNPALVITEEFLDTWKSMERLVDDGLVRHIGVCNFTVKQLDVLLSCCRISPVVNQVELHPYLQQPELVTYCKSHNIRIMAYSPLGSPSSYSGRTYPSDMTTTLIDHPVVKDIAARINKSPAQVLLLWSLTKGFVCIPKSANPLRIAQNYEASLLLSIAALSEEDMERLDGLDRGFRYGIGYIPGHYDCPNAPWCQSD